MLPAIYFRFVCIWSVGSSHDGPAVLLAYPAQVGHGLHDRDLGDKLTPEPTKRGFPKPTVITRQLVLYPDGLLSIVLW